MNPHCTNCGRQFAVDYLALQGRDDAYERPLCPDCWAEEAEDNHEQDS